MSFEPVRLNVRQTDATKLYHSFANAPTSAMAILTIHSHVSCGHVGNSAAVYPLQAIGHEVWPVHTVLLSHHPGHGDWHGICLEAADIISVLDGIEKHGVLPRCDAVLTGYLGSVDIGEAALKSWSKVRSANPSALIVCDPILGDETEGLYVSKSLIEFYIERAIPLADLIFPNRFELEVISGMKVYDLHSAAAAARHVVARGPKTVVATSIPADGNVATLLVTLDTALQVQTPNLKISIKGAGDVFAALFLGDVLARDVKPAETLSVAVDTVYALLEKVEAEGLQELPLRSISTPLGSHPMRYTASEFQR